LTLEMISLKNEGKKPRKHTSTGLLLIRLLLFLTLLIE
jgi:hypothetical protein